MSVLAFIIGVLVMVVGLAVSIALHEIGHLVPAKRFGVRVGQYMVGLGPTLWSRRYGETEYGVKLLPLGGFISMAGMYPPSKVAVGAGSVRSGFFRTMVQDARAANDETLDGEDDQRVFYRLPTWKKIVIMLGGPFMNLLFAIVLFTVLFSAIGVTTASTTLAHVSACMIPAGSSQTECEPGDPAAPAAAAGLQPGDRILQIDGRGMATFDDVARVIRDSPDRTLQVVIDRQGVQESLALTPVLAEQPVFTSMGRVQTDAAGEPTVHEVGFVGIGPQYQHMTRPVWVGPQQAIENLGAVVGVVAQLPVKLYEVGESLFTGAERDIEGPMSVVGVGVIAGEVASLDAPVRERVGVIVGLLGSLNIALFVFNLVPLLPLDGGHIAIALWDRIRTWWATVRGRPAPAPTDATRLVPVTFAVLLLLVGMSVLLITADIVNPMQLLP